MSLRNNDQSSLDIISYSRIISARIIIAAVALSLCNSCSKEPSSQQHRHRNSHHSSYNNRDYANGKNANFFANGRIIALITRPLVNIKYNASIQEADKIALANITKNQLEAMLPLEFVWDSDATSDGIINIEIKHFNSNTVGDVAQNPSVVSFYFKAYSNHSRKETLAFSSSFHFKDAALTDNLLRVAEKDKNAKIGITSWKGGFSVYERALRQIVSEFEEARASGFRRKVSSHQ